MRKRKGKWIAVSTSLIASLSIISHSGQAIMAQEASDDNASSDDSQWHAPAPEVSWQDVPEESATPEVYEEVVEEVVYEEPVYESVTEVVEEWVEEPVAEVYVAAVEEVAAEEVAAEDPVVAEVIEAEISAEVVETPLVEVDATEVVEEVIATEVVEESTEVLAEESFVGEAPLEDVVEEGEWVEETPVENEWVATETEISEEWVAEDVVEEVLTEEIVEETPVTELPVEEAPLEEAPLEEIPAEEVVEVEVPTEEITEDFAEELPVEEVIEETPEDIVEEAPIEETPEDIVDEAPIEETPEEASEEAPIEEPTDAEVEIPVESIEETEESNTETDAETDVETEPELETPEETEKPATQPEETQTEADKPVTTTPTQNNQTETTTSQQISTIQRTTAQQTQAEVTKHQVMRGDTLWSLAQRNNTTVENLRKWNNLADNTIVINHSLYVSDPAATTQTNDRRRQAEVKNYTINSGDTLYSIARRNNVTINDLKQWNNLTSDTIYTNVNLIISNPNATAEDDNVASETPVNNSASTKNYTVQSGDTLFAIARRNNVSVDQLREWNNISGSLIYANRPIIVSNPNGTSNNTNNTNNNSQATETPATNNQTHTVKRGEYLYSIATQYGVTVNQLREWNQLSSDMLYSNSQLIVSNPNANSTNPSNPSNPSNPANPANPTNPSTPTTPVTSNPDLSDASDRAQQVVQWFQEREGQTTYSMAYRNGPDSYDCSSAVFSALISAGYLSEGTWLGTTETLYGYEGSLLIPIAREDVQSGDIFVSGIKGQSLGSGGHTGVAVSNSQIIHSNYSDNGISTTAIEGYTASRGMPTYWYRLNDAFIAN